MHEHFSFFIIILADSVHDHTDIYMEFRLQNLLLLLLLLELPNEHCRLKFCIIYLDIGLIYTP